MTHRRWLEKIPAFLFCFCAFVSFFFRIFCNGLVRDVVFVLAFVIAGDVGGSGGGSGGGSVENGTMVFLFSYGFGNAAVTFLPVSWRGNNSAAGFSKIC